MAKYPYNTARWQRLRMSKLRAEPLCEQCKPVRIMPAKAVDHVKPISDGGDPFPPLDELRSLCLSCHSQKTARGPEAGAVKTTRPIQPRKGCDAQGNPTDPRHPWNLERQRHVTAKTHIGPTADPTRGQRGNHDDVASIVAPSGSVVSAALDPASRHCNGDRRVSSNESQLGASSTRGGVSTAKRHSASERRPPFRSISSSDG